MSEHIQIPVNELIVGRYYVGQGRNGNIGRWDGECFLVLAQCGKKVGPGPGDWENYWGVKCEPYFQTDGGTFQPFKQIDMGVVSVPYGEREYAKVMKFDD